MQPATDHHVIARRGFSPDVAISSHIEVKRRSFAGINCANIDLSTNCTSNRQEIATALRASQ